MRLMLILVTGILLGGGLMYGWMEWGNPDLDQKVEKAYPLKKYEIENLAMRKYDSQIEKGEMVATGSGYVVQKFYFVSDGKRVSGLAHIPDDCTKCAVIIQSRGYYPNKDYFQGAGTRKTAVQFAKAGFISLAADFLGYGESDNPSENVWEARFETYTTLLNLIAAAERWDRSNGKIGLWGHSNGGQITLSALAASGKGYPTILWAPVTVSFPYSVLYYTGDYEDRGKAIRKSLAEFEEDYDADKYFFGNYVSRIKASVLINQGDADPDVPEAWSRNLVKKMIEQEVDVVLNVLPGVDHNMQPKWNEVVQTDIEFYKKHW